MGTVTCKTKSIVTVSATVIRANGDIEELGVIATNKPTLGFNIKQQLKRFYRWFFN
jgi:hypothetical protein